MDIEEINGTLTIKPLDLSFDFEKSDHSENIEEEILPFHIESIDMEEQKQNEMVKKGRFPSFQGCQSEDEDYGDKMYSPDISFQL